MASQMRELKSILKPSRSSHAPESKSPAEAERIALEHARILQQQKDTELQILDAIETLSVFPPSSGHPASNPSASDTAAFASLIRPFQPSDYDDLVEERNILGRCGYALCPRPKRELGGRFTLVNHNRPDFAIVETKEVGRWCSDACARRALYVKVQLNEMAAWERVAMPDVRIDLMEEPSSSKTDSGEKAAAGKEEEQLARDVAALKLNEDRKAKSDSATLSLERGDVLERGDGDKSRKVPLAPKMELTIREKEVKSVAQPPRLDEASGDAQGVEGHVPRFGTSADDSGFEEESE